MSNILPGVPRGSLLHGPRVGGAHQSGNVHALLIAHVIMNSKFHYDREERLFTAEASDLKDHDFLSRVFLSRVFNDACDVGFRVVSSKTGREVVFTFSREERNTDSDVTAWHFTSYRAMGGNFKATIFND